MNRFLEILEALGAAVLSLSGMPVLPRLPLFYLLSLVPFPGEGGGSIPGAFCRGPARLPSSTAREIGNRVSAWPAKLRSPQEQGLRTRKPTLAPAPDSTNPAPRSTETSSDLPRLTR